MNKYLRTGVLSALLLSSHSSLANEYRIGQFSLNTINVAPYGLINGPLVSFNFSEINGLAAQQVQEIQDTIYKALSDTKVANLQSAMAQAGTHLDTYQSSQSSVVFNSASLATAMAVDHEAFFEVNVTDHYLLTAHLGATIGLRLSFLGELIETSPDYTNDNFTDDAKRYYLKLKDLGTETDNFVEGRMKITSYSATNCMIRSRSCYDYKVSDNIAGNSTWFRHSDHGLATYKNASYKRDVLIQGYKDKFKGDNYDSVLNELYIQAGSPPPE